MSDAAIVKAEKHRAKDDEAGNGAPRAHALHVDEPRAVKKVWRTDHVVIGMKCFMRRWGIEVEPRFFVFCQFVCVD